MEEEFGRRAFRYKRLQKHNWQEMRRNLNTVFSCSSLSIILFSLLLLYLCLQLSELQHKSAKVRVQVGNWLAVGVRPVLYTHCVCVCVLWCNHVCVDFLLAAGLTSCPMETHWLGFLFNGQSSQSSQRPVGSGLTVWPVAFWWFCLSGMKTSHLIHTLCGSFSYDKQSTATHESSTTQTRLRCRKHVGFIYYNCKQRMVK